VIARRARTLAPITLFVPISAPSGSAKAVENRSCRPRRNGPSSTRCTLCRRAIEYKALARQGEGLARRARQMGVGCRSQRVRCASITPRAGARFQDGADRCHPLPPPARHLTDSTQPTRWPTGRRFGIRAGGTGIIDEKHCSICSRTAWPGPGPHIDGSGPCGPDCRSTSEAVARRRHIAVDLPAPAARKVI